MTAATAYLHALQGCLDRLLQDEAAGIEQAAQRVADCIRDGGVLHVFGAGHSQLVAMDLVDRASGLAAVHPIVDAALGPLVGPAAADTERQSGYADTLLDRQDLREGEVLAVVSNSGINAVPVEVAIGAARRGLFVIAVTSRDHSDSVAPRNPAGRRLHEVADLTLDTAVPAGDSALHLDDGTATGPLSSIVAAAALHAVTSRAAELVVQVGDDPPVLVSRNLPDRDEANRELLARYAARRRT